MTQAVNGTYKLLKLTKRIGLSVLPKISLVDMKEEIKNRHPIISSLLEAKILERLNNGEQTMLLLNRRGYSTTVTCSACGFVFKCPHCDITLTYHKSSNSLRCRKGKGCCHSRCCNNDRNMWFSAYPHSENSRPHRFRDRY